MQGHAFDLSYKINHVSFGKDENFNQIQEKFSSVGIINPLDGVYEFAVFTDE